MAMTDDEIERYARHIVLRDVGGPGQQKLKAARVLIVGAGGLGAPVLMYLGAAGVGTLAVIDDDRVALSNLQRQVIHSTGDVGEWKVDSASRAIARLNPDVSVETHRARLTAANALGLISGHDLVIDGTDNFATRYLVNDACYFARRPLVSAAVGQFDAYITTFRAYERDDRGDPNPSYRCLFPEPPAPGMAPSCEEAGILGALTGVVGSFQAMEALKEILGIGRGLVGRLISYDAREARFHEVAYGWDPENPLNGRNPTIRDLSVHERG